MMPLWTRSPARSPCSGRLNRANSPPHAPALRTRQHRLRFGRVARPARRRTPAVPGPPPTGRDHRRGAALRALARRVGQPSVVGEIVAGLLLGPSLLGWLAPDLFTRLFRPHLEGVDQPLADALIAKVFTVIAQLGLIFLLFLVGLGVRGPPRPRQRPRGGADLGGRDRGPVRPRCGAGSRDSPPPRSAPGRRGGLASGADAVPRRGALHHRDPGARPDHDGAADHENARRVDHHHRGGGG